MTLGKATRETSDPIGSRKPDAAGATPGKSTRTMSLGADGAISPAVHQAVDGSTGTALPATARSALESSYGADLGGVRVHSGGPSSDAASSLGARAFAVGQDVHFGAGEYDPGSRGGFELLAHEVAHTVQARGAGDRVQAKLEVGAPGDAAELEADRAAASAVRGERFAISAQSSSVARMIRRVDQRAGTSIPTAATQGAIAAELYPASAPAAGGVAPPWDGATGQPNAAARRLALVTDMHAAMSAYLTATMNGPSGIRAVAAQPRVAIASLEGAGRAAKADADRHFSSWATASALTTAQESARTSYSISASGPSQNLFDAQSPADRQRAGMGIDEQDLASWIAETAPASVAALNRHHLDKNRSAEERNFLRQQIVEPWARANTADLRLFDQHGFALSNPETGQIVLPTSLPLGQSTTSPGGGVPSPAERSLKWSSWRTMVHEYIHQLEHPRLRSWPGRNRTIGEGFCELFTKEVLQPLLPAAAGADVTRRTQVEGADHGAPPSGVIAPYNPGEYADYLAHAEAIQRHLGGASTGAQNAMKAVFFQGHIEFLGFDQAGGALTAPAGAQDQIQVPTTITTFAALAVAVNVREPDLRTDNPGVSEPLTGRLRARGCREHRVVTSSDGAGTAAESRRVIATQNGVTETDLTRANPTVNWTTLSAGQLIIIPSH